MTASPARESIEEPAIPLRLQRPLAALWISLALHGALIALVQVAPPAAPGAGSVIEARLVSRQASAVAVPPGDTVLPDVAVPLTARGSPETPPAAEPPSPPVSPRAADPAAPAEAGEEPGTGPSTTGAISLPVDLTYYRARELDVQPRALGAIEPVYPPEADRQQRSGRVRLQLKLEADGRVSEVEIIEAEPAGLFEASAVEAFRAARFSPAQRDGRPVRALLLIEVNYDWAGRR